MSNIIKAHDSSAQELKPFEAEEAVVLSEFVEPEEGIYEFSDSDPVTSAEQKAVAIVDKAMKRAREIEQQAFERGYQTGEKAARENMQRQITDIAVRFGDALTELSDLEDKIFRQSELNMVDLILRIARKVVDREVLIQPDIALEMVRQCVTRVSGSPFIRVRVSPEDYSHIYDFKTSIPINPDRVKSFTIEADPAIETGGCIVETNSGSVDARIGKQFSEITKSLLGLQNEDH
ncbi:MAG: FliH/SctL family protein [Nitrospirota bacterium]|nr:FliH/SctL family protein [Nitrospirota bacterium]